MSEETNQKSSNEGGAATGATRKVECVKLGRSLPGLPKPPIKGKFGQRVFDEVSRDGWQMWLEHSKMVVNEYHLDLTTEGGQKRWLDELDKFFWGEGGDVPPEFVPPKRFS